MKPAIAVALIPCAFLFACNRADVPPVGTDSNVPEPSSLPNPTPLSTPDTATVMLAGTRDSPVRGELRLATAEGGVSVAGEVAGLAPGAQHGFHVHEHGDCSAPDASSAGEHLNPTDARHGRPGAGEHHLGDISNLLADENGRATVSTVIRAATLRDGGPNNLVGKAFVVHAQPDDYTTQPAGNSGARLACGVVQ